MARRPLLPTTWGGSFANESLIGAIEHLTREQLALPVGSPSWPIWASVSHVAGTRVYWLCHVFGEPGKDMTPFRTLDIASAGWEDDLAHPRRADELVAALTSSWEIVARCLVTWTPGRSVRRRSARGATRFKSILANPCCGV